MSKYDWMGNYYIINLIADCLLTHFKHFQKNTFNMRQVTLMNLAANHLSLRGNNQSRHALNCMQNGCIANPIKSLDILRKNIQSAINKDIDNIIRKYVEVCVVIFEIDLVIIIKRAMTSYLTFCCNIFILKYIINYYIGTRLKVKINNR